MQSNHDCDTHWPIYAHCTCTKAEKGVFFFKQNILSNMLTLVSLTELFGQVILTDSKQFINAISGQNNPIIWEENCSQGQNFIFKSFDETFD